MLVVYEQSICNIRTVNRRIVVRVLLLRDINFTKSVEYIAPYRDEARANKINGLALDPSIVLPHVRRPDRMTRSG